MIKLTIANVKKYLESRSMQFHLQKDSNQLYAFMVFEDQEFPLFLRIYEHNSLLQLLLFFPSTIKSGAQSDLARSLLLVNKTIDIPGFGMDEVANVVFYRLMLLSYEEQLDERLIGVYLDTTERIFQSLAAPIMAIAQGQLTFETFRKQLESATPKV